MSDTWESEVKVLSLRLAVTRGNKEFKTEQNKTNTQQQQHNPFFMNMLNWI